MSCGDFDGNHMRREAKKKQLIVPNYLKRWINLKKAFCYVGFYYGLLLINMVLAMNFDKVY